MKDSRHAPLLFAGTTGVISAALVLLLLTASTAAAQSVDIAFPTPVSTNQISGTIVARDIGDARLTRHFYILSGTPGDLIFTVTSNNLNGDVDLFTAGSLRPLGKISVYAGSGPSTASKTVFLRQRESLILRVEARSANDNEGTYSISFAGTFEPVMAAATPAEETGTTPTASERTERGVRRVTSSGARIDEPEPEISARTETTTETTATTETESRTETAAPAPRPEPTARTTRPTRPRGRRRNTRVTPQPQPQPQPSEPSTESATTTNPSTSETNPSTSEPALNPRLIIETRDGMRTERFMSTVRSVTVQNGQIVIVSSNGRRIERISLARILKMSIEP